MVGHGVLKKCWGREEGGRAGERESGGSGGGKNEIPKMSRLECWGRGGFTPGHTPGDFWGPHGLQSRPGRPHWAPGIAYPPCNCEVPIPWALLQPMPLPRTSWVPCTRLVFSGFFPPVAGTLLAEFLGPQAIQPVWRYQ